MIATYLSSSTSQSRQKIFGFEPPLRCQITIRRDFWNFEDQAKYDHPLQYKSALKPRKTLNSSGKDVLNCYNRTDEKFTCHSVTDLSSTVQRNLWDSTDFHTFDIQDAPSRNGNWQVSIDRGIFAKNEIPCEVAI